MHLLLVWLQSVSIDVHLPPPSRTNWTHLVPPSVLTGHVSSLLQRYAGKHVPDRLAVLNDLFQSEAAYHEAVKQVA